MLYRVFVEKKPGLDPESAKLLADCRTFLGLKSLTRLRVLNRYDLEGLDESLFQRVKGTVLSEPQLDTVTEALSAPDAAAPPCWRFKSRAAVSKAFAICGSFSTV